MKYTSHNEPAVTQVFSHQQPASYDLKYNMCRRFLWINVATSISIQESKDFFHLLSTQSTCERVKSNFHMQNNLHLYCRGSSRWMERTGSSLSASSGLSKITSRETLLGSANVNLLIQLSVSRGLSNSECLAWYKYGHHKTALLNAQAIWNESNVLLNVWTDVEVQNKRSKQHTSEEIAHK